MSDLLAPVAKADWSTESPVRIGARGYNGATYVIAVNTSTTPTTTSFTLPGLGVAVYVVPPPGW